MFSRPLLTVLCLLSAALSAAGQQAGTVRDFPFTVETHPFLTLSNPALLDRFDGQVSQVQSHFRKENGGWLSPTESPDSWDAGASAQSYRRIGPNLTFFGSLGWQHFTGKDMGGQVLLDYTYNPINFLESSDNTKGTKKRERYALSGGMSYRLGRRWAAGIQLNFTSADQTKTKDPRFSNVWMDLDLKAGVSFQASDRWVLGAAFLFRNTLEQVKGGIYGTTDQQYFLQLDKGCHMGTVFELAGDYNPISVSNPRPMMNYFWGGSLQAVLDGRFANELVFQVRNGYYGRRSSTTATFFEYGGIRAGYKGKLLIPSGRNLQVLSLEAGLETLTNLENKFRYVTPTGQNTVVEYTGQSRIMDRLLAAATLSYAWHQEADEGRPSLTLGARLDGRFRNQTTSLYPFTRRQQVTVLNADLYGEKCLPAGTVLLDFSLHALVGGGFGIPLEDSSAAETASTSIQHFDNPLFRQYEYETALHAGAELSFGIRFPVKGAWIPYVRVSDRFVSLLSAPVYLDGGRRNVAMISLGCCF